MSDDENKQDAEFKQLEHEMNIEAANDSQYGEPENTGPSNAEVLQGLLDMGFSVLAPNWGVQQAEIEQLAKG